jgi:hypothetical protein
MLRFPHCLDNRLTDGGKVVSPTHRPRSSLQIYYFSAFGTYLCQRPSKPQDLVWPEGVSKLKKFVPVIGSRTCGFLSCSIVP